ncbi:hypothetical protein [Erythrobacter sp. SAORIC-644]|uniref:hypothetical protein n=1 Tax=Erythrobacter sp. SAORIC-644 TaxID=1869314 RepID=UPI0011AF9A90|nr:hypothetical protein [Erythrobacter sp. SAORIC-644]
MFLPILAAAASFSTPSVDVNVAMEINRNLHRSVDRQRKWTAAEIEVFADPKGKVLTCEVRRFLPYEDVADEMCRVLIGSRVVPAQDFQGEKSYGLVLMMVAVDNDGESNLAARLGGLQQDGIVLTVSQLPDSMSATRLLLDLVIGADGKVSRCEGHGNGPEAFRAVACEQASANGFDVRADANGNAVPYVRNFEVTFELAAD